jgi:hypothetical protein
MANELTLTPQNVQELFSTVKRLLFNSAPGGLHIY